MKLSSDEKESCYGRTNGKVFLGNGLNAGVFDLKNRIKARTMSGFRKIRNSR